MDIIFVFQKAGEFFIKFCSVTFTVAGYRLSVGSFFVFAALVVILINFLRKLGD